MLATFLCLFRPCILLLSDSCKEDQLTYAQECLEEFYRLIPSLYTQKLCTMNVYSLIHLVAFVRLWGPLWTHSSFGYESMNDSLLAQIHGTRDVLQHIVFRIRMKQQISLQKYNSLPQNSIHVAVA